MDEFDIPIFKILYELYETFYSYRNLIPKQERYSLYLRCENKILDALEHTVLAAQANKADRLFLLERSSGDLSLLRVLFRLLKEIKAIDNKKYVLLQETINETGKMLGGWIRSTK